MSERVGAGFEIRGGRGFNGSACVKNGYTVGKLERKVNVMRYKYDRLPLVRHLAEHLQSLKRLVKTHARRGLVRDYELRVRNKSR